MKSQNKILGGLAVLAGVGLGFFAYKKGLFGSSTAGLGYINSLPSSKRRALEWLSQQTGKPLQDPIIHEVIDYATGMEKGDLTHLVKARVRDEINTVEYVGPDGIGRPE